MKFKLKEKINELRQLGWRVEIEHLRKVDAQHNVSPRGGATIVKIVNEEERLLASSLAQCSEQDNYNRRIGATIALGRALKQLESL